MGAGEALREVFDALLAQQGETILLIRDGRVVLAFGQASLGYGPEIEAGHHIAEYAHPDDVPDILDIARRVQEGEAISADLRLRARTGDGGWALTEGSVTDRSNDPRLRGTVVRLRMIDDSAEAPRSATAESGTRPGSASAPPHSEPLHDPDATPEYEFPSAATGSAASAGALASLAEVVPAGILATDLNGFVVYSNAATHSVLGYAGEELSGDGWRAIVHPDDVHEVARTSAAALRGETRERLFRVKHPEGDRWILGRFAPLRPAGEITGLVASFDDVTTQRAVEDALAYRATHDPLTDLPNRSLLLDRLALAMGRVDRTDGRVAVLFVDLDGFKAINDEMGHAHGDRVLVEVARRLSGSIRPPDTVARLGGDEFVVVCEGLSSDDARRLGARLQEAIALPAAIAYPNRANDTDAEPIGASIGIAMVRPPCTSDDALRCADQAMYRAKQAGAGGIELAEC